MSRITRRSILGGGLGAAALGQAAPGQETARRLKPRPSREIQASRLSIGFETLDRKMFDPERTYPHLAELGVKWARCQTGWSRCETEKGKYDFRWLDDVVDKLRAAGVEPWFNVGFGNILYTPGAAHPSAVGWAPVFSDEAKQAWLRYVAQLAERYRDRVKVWEIWNEPNGAGFWRPREPQAKDYVALVQATAPVVRKRVPGAVIVGGAFAGAHNVLDYFQECLRHGMGDLVDKISYHPYRPQPEWNYENDVAALRGLIARYKPGIELWQGENGAPSSNVKGTGAMSNLLWTEPAQARWLLRRVITDLKLDLGLVSYFHSVDMVNYIWATGPTDLTNHKGVIRGTDYTRKPSYYAYQNICALFDSGTTPAGLLIRFEQSGSRGDEMLMRSAAFIRAGRPMYAFWYPSNLQEEYTPRTAHVTVWGGDAAPLERPVLIDMLSGAITPANAARKGGFWHLAKAAIPDYPVILTDESVLA